MEKDNKLQVKKTHSEFLLLLLSEIEANGSNISQLAKNLNWSKQRLNYHLNTKLKRLNWVKKTQSYPFAIYSLTEFGKQVKNILGQPDSVKGLYRCHALITGFKILDYGNFDWKDYKIKHMNNWDYMEDSITDSIGIWKININTEGTLKIYCPEITSDNPNQAFGIMYDISTKLANKYAEMNGMKIGLMYIIREGHKELINSEILGKLLGNTKIGKVWADNSTGTKCLEESQSSSDIENLLKMPNRVESMEKAITELLVPSIEKQTEQNKWMTDNLITHRRVLEGIETAITELREEIRRMGK